MASIEIKIKPLALHDVVFLQMPPGRREDGFRELPKIKIVDLTRDQLEALLTDFNESMMTMWLEHNERNPQRG